MEPRTAAAHRFVARRALARRGKRRYTARMIRNAMPGGPSPWRQVGMLAPLGLTLGVATAIGVGVGVLVDRWLASAPWGLVVGLLLGVVAGFRQVLRDIRRATLD